MRYERSGCQENLTDNQNLQSFGFEQWVEIKKGSDDRNKFSFFAGNRIIA